MKHRSWLLSLFAPKRETSDDETTAVFDQRQSGERPTFFGQEVPMSKKPVVGMRGGLMSVTYRAPSDVREVEQGFVWGPMTVIRTVESEHGVRLVIRSKSGEVLQVTVGHDGKLSYAPWNEPDGR